MGVAYEILVAPAAEREIRKLRPKQQTRILDQIEALRTEPRPRGVEKLSQNPRFWRIRAGDYRVIYFIDDQKRLTIVLVVRHRKDAYRNLEQLNPQIVAATLAQLASVHLRV